MDSPVNEFIAAWVGRRGGPIWRWSLKDAFLSRAPPFSQCSPIPRGVNRFPPLCPSTIGFLPGVSRAWTESTDSMSQINPSSLISRWALCPQHWKVTNAMQSSPVPERIPINLHPPPHADDVVTSVRLVCLFYKPT